MTKDEFRFRWNKDDCDITFDEVAECAKEWGLYNHPRCHPMEEVRYRVLLAAECEDAEKYNPTRYEEKCVIEATKNDLIRELWHRMRDRGEIQWRTKDGRMIPIKDITDSHLLNALRMFHYRDEFDELGYEAMLDIIDTRRDW